MKGRRIAVIGLLALLVTMTTACGIGKRWIFSLNGKKLYDKDVDAYGYVYAMTHNIADDGQMDKAYDEEETYSEHYKKELEDEILSNVLLSKEAKDAGIKVTSKQKKACKKKAETLCNTYGEERLKQQNLTREDIQNVYEVQKLSELYVAQQQKKDDSDTKDEETKRYISVFQVMFPTVEFDENGLVVSDENGTVINVSSQEMEQQNERANEFRTKVADGQDIETVLKEYSSNATGVSKNLKYDDLDAAYKKEVDKLSEGQVSNVFEGTYGYYIIRLDQKDANEYAGTIIDYEQQENTQNLRKELLDDLYVQYVGTDKNYRNDKKWEQVNIIDYLQ